MKSFTEMLAKVMLALALLTAAASLTGCSDETTNPLPDIAIQSGSHGSSKELQSAPQGSSTLGQVEHQVRHDAKAAGIATAGVLMMAAIMALPWLVLLLVPLLGIGQAERYISSLGIICLAAFVAWYSDTPHQLGLIPWLWFLSILPAVVAVWFKDQGSRYIVFALPSIAYCFYLVWKIIDWMCSGLIQAPITMLCVLAGLVLLVLLMAGGKKQTAH